MGTEERLRVKLKTPSAISSPKGKEELGAGVTLSRPRFCAG